MFTITEGRKALSGRGSYAVAARGKKGGEIVTLISSKEKGGEGGHSDSKSAIIHFLTLQFPKRGKKKS